MIVTAKKSLAAMLEMLKDYHKVFLVGCGECATTCKTGGKDELAVLKQELERKGKIVLGACLPEAPCVAVQVRKELAKNKKPLEDTQAIIVLACGLGVQSVKENNRSGITVLPALDTVFGASLDTRGNFYEKCSLCGDCVLDITQGMCPVTLCPKGLLNGPCSGVDKGKCEIDKQIDCVWVTIYEAASKKGRLSVLKKIQKPKDFKKTTKPRKLILQ